MPVSSPLPTLLDRYLPAVEAELEDLLASSEARYSDFYDILQYHMGWLDLDRRPIRGHTGKRVRPALCLLACEAAGGAFQQALPAAAGIEMLHNFSLLHDDIEDRSATRRGRPTVWRLWGEAQAINAGDGLFALAHLAFARLPDRGIPVQRAFAAEGFFDRTCLELTHGQHLDMRFETRLDVTVDEYMTMITGKSAALIAAATYLGAWLAGATEAVAGKYLCFGHHLGLAFQIKDDILGIWGDAEVTGKSTSDDIQTRKKTLPVVYALERSLTLRQLYAVGSIPPEQVSWVVNELARVGAREMAESASVQHHRKALDVLEQSGARGDAGTALADMAANLLTRVS